MSELKQAPVQQSGPGTVDELIKTLRESGQLRAEPTPEMRRALEQVVGPSLKHLREARAQVQGLTDEAAKLRELSRLGAQLEKLELQATQLVLTRSQAVQVNQYNTVRFSVPTSYGTYLPQQAHVAIDANSGELMVWSGSARTERGGAAPQWRKSEEASGPPLTAMYVYQGKVYDRTGKEVQMLQNAGLGSQVSTSWMVSQMSLKAGQVATVDDGRMAHVATHEGKVAVFTLGPPPAFRHPREHGPGPAVHAEPRQPERVVAQPEARREARPETRPAQRTEPAYDTVTYHTPQGGCYWQRMMQVRLSNGSDGLARGTLEQWNGAAWEKASTSHPQRQMACLYCVGNKVYDEGGRQVHHLSDDGNIRRTEDLLHGMNLREGRVSTVAGRAINNVTHGGRPVVFTKGPPPGFEAGFVQTELGGDYASLPALVRPGQSQRVDLRFDPQSGTVTYPSGNKIEGFEVTRDGSGRVTGALWSNSLGQPQMRVVPQGNSWVVERRIHDTHHDAWGRPVATYSIWTQDHTAGLKVSSPARASAR